MKRIASAVLLLFAVFAVTCLAYGQASVPNLINFQGLLTDTAGAPVSDGSHAVDFRIYTALSGGSLLWTELTTQNTVNGVFTHQLGSVTPIPFGYYTIPGAYDSLFLELTVEGEIILPRTHLTSTPFARLANGLEVQSAAGGIDDTVVMRINDVDYWLNIYGDDGTQRARLGSWNSGRLDLFNSSAVQTISLNGGSTGNASAILPSGAISSPEMLDEPGIAHQFNFATAVLTSSIDVAIDTITITVPTAGYMVVTAHGFFLIVHTNGTRDNIRASISTTTDHDFDNFTLQVYDADHPSENDIWSPFSCTKVEAVTAGAHTYFLVGDMFSGTLGAIGRRHLTAMFFPTAYGTVVSTIASKGGLAEPSSADGSGYQSQVEVITVEDHNARIQAEIAQMKAEIEARLEKLESQIGQPRSRKPNQER